MLINLLSFVKRGKGWAPFVSWVSRLSQDHRSVLPACPIARSRNPADMYFLLLTVGVLGEPRSR